MTILSNYPGNVQPIIFFSFRSDVVDGAHSSANPSYSYVVNNEAMYSFEVRATRRNYDLITTLRHRATESTPFYDDTVQGYIAEPIQAFNVEALITAHQQHDLMLFLNLSIWLKPFFYEMIDYFTSTEGDRRSLARPLSEAAVLANLDIRGAGDHLRISHPRHVSNQILHIPCAATYIHVPGRPDPDGHIPVRLWFEMLLDQVSAAERRRAEIILIAADYTKVHDLMPSPGSRLHPWYGDAQANTPFSPLSQANEPPGATAAPRGGTVEVNVTTGAEARLETPERNVANYLRNHTSLTRGQAIMDEIIRTAESNINLPQREVVNLIRNEIDARLITANHWAEDREDARTEYYQYVLSNVFGAIFHDKPLATPVRFLRDMVRAGRLTREDKARLTLQWGLGHCGEHACVSWVVISTLMMRGRRYADKFENIIYTGNVNIDHEFIVGGIRIFDAVTTLRRRPTSGSRRRGAAVLVWDLAATLADPRNLGRDGFVLDPYLSRTGSSGQGAAWTARDLLSSLTGSYRQGQGADTHYLVLPVDPAHSTDQEANSLQFSLNHYPQLTFRPAPEGLQNI